MRLRSSKGLKVLSVTIVLSLFVFAVYATAAQEEPKKESTVPEQEVKDTLPKTKKDISGVVVDMLSGEAVPDATVSLLKETVQTGKDGKFVLKGINEFHSIQMTARITTELDIIIGCSYFFVPTSYYPISANKGNKADIQVINMVEDTDNVVLKIAAYDNGTVDQFCANCHAESPCLIDEEYGKIADEKKMKLRGVMVRQSELEKYITEMRTKEMNLERYSSIRYIDSHPQAIDITVTDSFYEERVVLPEDLPLKEDKIIICDTCHTRHLATEWEQYMIMDFMQRESICIKCHR
jgi:hypothetical protein